MPGDKQEELLEAQTMAEGLLSRKVSHLDTEVSQIKTRLGEFQGSLSAMSAEVTTLSRGQSGIDHKLDQLMERSMSHDGHITDRYDAKIHGLDEKTQAEVSALRKSIDDRFNEKNKNFWPATTIILALITMAATLVGNKFTSSRDLRVAYEKVAEVDRKRLDERLISERETSRENDLHRYDILNARIDSAERLSQERFAGADAMRLADKELMDARFERVEDVRSEIIANIRQLIDERGARADAGSITRHELVMSIVDTVREQHNTLRGEVGDQFTNIDTILQREMRLLDEILQREMGLHVERLEDLINVNLKDLDRVHESRFTDREGDILEESVKELRQSGGAGG